MVFTKSFRWEQIGLFHDKSLEQGSANPSQWPKSLQLHVSANEALAAHGPTHLLTRGLWRLCTKAKPSSLETLLAHKASDLNYLAFYRESTWTPVGEWRTRAHTHMGSEIRKAENNALQRQ